jgi:hypothetical protein
MSTNVSLNSGNPAGAEPNSAIACIAGIFVQVYGIAASKFETACVGTRVAFPMQQFVQEFVAQAVNSWKGPDRAPGQHFIQLKLNEYMLGKFLSGVGRRTTDPKEYFPALWRGEVVLLGRRKLAEPTTGVAVIVYTREAYLNDPQIDEAGRRWLDPRTTHVLVDVLAFSNTIGSPQLSPHRFVRNMAGGNNTQLTASADELRAEAQLVAAYDASYVTVGDD